MNLLSWSRSASVAVVAFTVLAACSSEPTIPGGVNAVYVATSVGGSAIPRTVVIDGNQHTLLADTLRLWSDGSSRHTQVVRRPGPGSTTEVFKYESKLKYEVNGARLTFILKCPANALCAAPPIGTFIPSGVTLSYSVLGTAAGELMLTRVE